MMTHSNLTAIRILELGDYFAISVCPVWGNRQVDITGNMQTLAEHVAAQAWLSTQIKERDCPALPNVQLVWPVCWEDPTYNSSYTEPID